MNTRALAIGITCIATGLLGCDGGPAGPDTRSTPAFMFVGVNVPATSRADTSATAYVSGNLMPGRAARGAVRAVASPLRLGGRALTFGASLDSHGSHFLPQTTTSLGTALGRQPLTVEPPALAEVTPNRGPLRVSTLRAFDADTVRLGADGALRIHVAAAPGDASASMRQWVVTVTGAQALTYRGNGLPPTDIVVPRDLLPPATPSGQWRVQLDFQEGHGSVYGPPIVEPTPPAYDVRVLYQQYVFWTILR
ncbi:MAG: hypothetical protein ACXW0Z_21535 [Gemmatirosa sp.]